jgi:hypothetical protein
MPSNTQNIEPNQLSVTSVSSTMLNDTGLDYPSTSECSSASLQSPPASPSKRRARPVVGVVCIVDLAPPESVRLSGQRRGAKVNQSLLALNKVIHELAAGGPHVSYRGSKLTRLLEPCLSINCRISILCCMTTSPW